MSWLNVCVATGDLSTMACFFENEESSETMLKILENCPKTTFQIVQSEDGLYRVYEENLPLGWSYN